MIRLNKYSLRILTLTSFVFIILNLQNLVFSPYLSIPICLLPWIIYDLFLPDHIISGKYAGNILQFVSVLASMVLLDTTLFSGFLILLLFQNF